MGNKSYTLFHVGQEYAHQHDGNNETNPQKVSTETEEEKVSSNLSKEDLLNNLRNNIEGTLNVVRNVETSGKSHVEKLKEICEIMSKAEEELTRFILEMRNEIQREEKGEQLQQGHQTDMKTGEETQNIEMTIQENKDSKGEKESVVNSSVTSKEHKEENRNEVQAEEKSKHLQQGLQTVAIQTGKETQNAETTIQVNNKSQGEEHSAVSSRAAAKKQKKKKKKQSGSTCESQVSEADDKLRRDMLSLQKDNEKMHDINQNWETFATTMKKELVECQTQNKELIRNNEELLNRLSKIAGQKLREDNPAITDLSDPNRPTKLGEVYSELYDNEWTDAFEELHSAGYSEEECITTLRQTLVNVIDFCRRKSEGLLKKTEEAVHILFEEFKQTKQMNNFGHLTMPRKQVSMSKLKCGQNITFSLSDDKNGKYLSRFNMKKMEHFGKMIREASFEEYLGADIILQQKWKPKHWKPDGNVNQNNKVETPEAVKKQLKIFRKEVAESMVPLVQKAYMSASWSEQGCLSTLKPYILKCLFLGWMMVVQSPPLALSTWNPGDIFNKDLYKDYTKSGHTIEYVVWPALLLQENGPLIGKGVAQGGKPTVVGDDNKDKVEETHNLNNTSN